MSFIPDVLLTPSVEPSVRPGKVSGATEPLKNKSFADVYAAQSEPKKASEGPKKSEKTDASDTESSVSSPKSEANATEADSEVVAESGKTLPDETQAEPTAPVVELLQSPLWELVNTQPTTAEVDPAWLAGLAGQLPVQARTDIRIDPTLEKLSSAQVAAPLAKLTAEESTNQEPAAELSDLLLDTELVQEVGIKFESLVSKAAATAEPVVDQRLTALAQAVSVQAASNVAKPAALVPGQALNLHQQGVSEAVFEKVMWMSSQNLKSAQIQLDPAELGRLDVRVSMQGDQAQVVFASSHAAVRDALEMQMQRLRELFTQQGMGQLDVSVADRSPQQQERESGSGRAGQGLVEHADDAVITSTTALADSSQGTGLVDYYA